MSQKLKKGNSIMMWYHTKIGQTSKNRTYRSSWFYTEQQKKNRHHWNDDDQILATTRRKKRCKQCNAFTGDICCENCEIPFQCEAFTPILSNDVTTKSHVLTKCWDTNSWPLLEVEKVHFNDFKKPLSTFLICTQCYTDFSGYNVYCCISGLSC